MCQRKSDRSTDEQRLVWSCLLEEFAYGDISCRTQFCLVSWAIEDIGNAYFEAETSEKVFVIVGPEFGELEGYTLVIFKALYRLWYSVL